MDGGNASGLPRGFGARNDNNKILWPLAVSALVVALWAVVEKLTGLFAVADFWPRVTGPFPYPNALGLFLGPLALIMVGWFFSVILERNPAGRDEAIGSRDSIGRFAPCRMTKLIIVCLTIMLSLLAIFFARSEGALVGIIVGLLVFGILAGGRLCWATLTITLAAGIGVLAYSPARDYAIDKITLRDLSGEIRKQQWRETWAMMTESPQRFIFGAGLSGYQAAVAPYHQEGIFFNFDREPWEEFHRQTVFNEEYRRTHWQPVEIYMYPHNIILNFWTELGLAGLVLFAWIIGKFIFLIFNFQFSIFKQYQIFNIKYLNLGLLGAMSVIIVHGLVDVPYFKNDLAVLFWVILAMGGLTSLINNRKV